MIDETGKAVVRQLHETDVDSIGNPLDTAEGREIIARYGDDITARIGELRSARAGDAEGRALLDAFADVLSPLLKLTEGEGFSSIPAIREIEMLDAAYFVLDRSARRAGEQAGNGPAARQAAGERFRTTMASTLDRLRNAKDTNVSKPLLAAYADYLEAFDPFAEESAFHAVSSDAAATPDSPAGRSVEAVLNDFWKFVDQYQRSYNAAIQFAGPVDNHQEMDAALARHFNRVERLEKQVRTNAAGDPLLLSLADYLIVASKPPASQTDQPVGPVMAFSMINLVHSNLGKVLTDARAATGHDPSEFDRELAREIVTKARTWLLGESNLQAQRDPEARDLLTRHAEYVRRFLDDGSILSPETEKPAAAAAPAVATSGPPASADRAPAAGMSDRVVLDVVWRIAEQYRQSHTTASNFAAGKPAGDAKAGEAMARHIQRIGRMAEDLRRRTAGDPLLTSVADFLTPHSLNALETLSLILMARDNLVQVRKYESPWNPDMNDFDRSLIRESVIQAMESTFEDLDKRAKADERSRDLLARYAEVLKRYMNSDTYLFPELAGSAPVPGVATSGMPAPAAAPDPKPAAPQTSGTEPAVEPFGGGGGFSGPSPEEVRQKVAGLAATMASVDKDPNNRKVYDVLDRPTSLKAEDGATLGKLIEQVKSSLKAEDGSTVPLYVDPKGLEAADASLDSPVSIDLDEVPLKFALRLALKQLGLAHCVRDGVLIISSLEGVEQELLEAQRELMSTYPDRFILDPDGSIRPAAGMAQPGGMM